MVLHDTWVYLIHVHHLQWHISVFSTFNNWIILPHTQVRGILTTTPSTPTVSSFWCVFEISISDPLCGITQETTDDFNWMRKTSDDPSFTDPEPSVDHTSQLNHGMSFLVYAFCFYCFCSGGWVCVREKMGAEDTHQNCILNLTTTRKMRAFLVREHCQFIV